MSHLFLQFQTFFQHYGLLAVFVVLLLENFGLPLPGELALLYAGYHQRVHGGFGFAALVVAGTLASAAGQTAGYGIGRYGRNWALQLFPLRGGHHARVSLYFERHGPPTIFFSRFIAGLRVFAGLVAGLGNMAWGPFLFYNLLGAVVWVTVIGGAGALMGAHWRRLAGLLGRVDLLLLALAAAAVALAWQRLRREHHG